MNNKLNDSASFLVYGDYRVSLEKKVFEIISKILDTDLDILKQSQDVKMYDELKIDDVREIILSSVQGTYNLKKRVYILNNIHLLRNEVVNALLKLIEEPPKDVYIFLLTRKLDILQTIKSRCLIINLNLNNKVNISDYNTYKFLEYNIDDYIEYEKQGLGDINIDSFKQVLEYIKNYFSDDSFENKVKYLYAVKYLLEEIYFLAEDKLIFLKDCIFDILSEKNDNKITRENMLKFFNSCINKLVIKGEISKIERLLRYKQAIKSNVNLKLIFLLFMLALYEK